MAATIYTTQGFLLCEIGLSVFSASPSRILNTGSRWEGALGPSRPSLLAAQQQTAALSVCPTRPVTSLTSPCRCVEVLVRTRRSLKVPSNLYEQQLLIAATLIKHVSSALKFQWAQQIFLLKAEYRMESRFWNMQRYSLPVFELNPLFWPAHCILPHIYILFYSFTYIYTFLSWIFLLFIFHFLIFHISLSAQPKSAPHCISLMLYHLCYVTNRPLNP